jgi:hypothetical protein
LLRRSSSDKLLCQYHVVDDTHQTFKFLLHIAQKGREASQRTPFPGNVHGQRVVHRLLPLEHKPHIDTFLLHVDCSAVVLQHIAGGERDGRQRIAWPSWQLPIRAGVRSCCLQCPTRRGNLRRATNIDNTGAIVLIRDLVISS